MEDTVVWYKTKTFWFLAVGVVAQLFKLLGFDISLDLQSELTNWIVDLVTLLSLGGGFYGRVKATKRVTMTKVDVTKILPLLTVLIVSAPLLGCASILQATADTFDVTIVPSSVQQNALKAAKVALVAWSGPLSEECKAGSRPAEECIGGIQEIIYRYGKLPPCSTTTVLLLCRDQHVWERLRTLEFRTTSTLVSMTPLLEADTETGALLEIPGVIFNAKAALDAEFKGGATQ